MTDIFRAWLLSQRLHAVGELILAVCVLLAFLLFAGRAIRRLP